MMAICLLKALCKIYLFVKTGFASGFSDFYLYKDRLHDHSFCHFLLVFFFCFVFFLRENVYVNYHLASVFLFYHHYLFLIAIFFFFFALDVGILFNQDNLLTPRISRYVTIEWSIRTEFCNSHDSHNTYDVQWQRYEMTSVNNNFNDCFE